MPVPATATPSFVFDSVMVMVGELLVRMNCVLRSPRFGLSFMASWLVVVHARILALEYCASGRMFC